MTPILVTQRVDINKETLERRDALDQRWFKFLSKCGILPIPVPNTLLEGDIGMFNSHFGAQGILLTGGNNLTSLGGDAPERDKLEQALIKYALSKKLPILGVCRGMQVIQHFFGISLRKVHGHVVKEQKIIYRNSEESVNSYHDFGTFETVVSLSITGIAPDGVVKSIENKSKKLAAIMWHPERLEPFSERDFSLFQEMFKSAKRQNFKGVSD